MLMRWGFAGRVGDDDAALVPAIDDELAIVELTIVELAMTM